MTNVLVGLIFVVHLAVGAAAFEITLTGRRWRLPVPLAATQNYLDIEVQALPVLLSLMYFQYLRHARAVVQKALTADCHFSEAYIRDHCNTTFSQDTKEFDMQRFGLAELTCDDGGFGYFVSKFDACQDWLYS